ncbi:hypothetical protein D3C80_1427010 [compost metagenome]
MQGVLVAHEALGGTNHALLPSLTLVIRQVAATAHQAVSHAHIDLRQFRHRRLVRQAT